MHAPVNVEPDAASRLNLDAATIIPLLNQIPAILVGIDEIRELLSGRLKSHFTIDEVAAQVGRAPYTVRTWIKDGRLKATRVQGTGPKGRLLVRREELRRLIVSGFGSDLPITSA